MENDKSKTTDTSKSPATSLKRKTPHLTAGDYKSGKEGGFIKAKGPKIQRIKWTVANDRKLLLLAMGHEISAKEYPIIAASFEERPTSKAIQERLTKLRKEQSLTMAQLNLTPSTIEVNEVNSEYDVLSTGEVEASELDDTTYNTVSSAPKRTDPPVKKPKKTGTEMFLHDGIPLTVLAAAGREVAAEDKAAAEAKEDEMEVDEMEEDEMQVEDEEYEEE